ncbi:hypothetical protein CVT26_003335 [Gymnopilus dilepis]|uniref:DUF6533 domain-containing protein n=1 Tax=Gymnopilus dilepis TaxID=231916 RepID=A0A409W2W4_9AGAR|nr:hypothetical protein CVT26_003335 [Gymnopilus dilepis]
MAPAISAVASNVGDLSSPLLYLPPHLARQVNILIYVHIGTTAVLIWDFLDNLRSDWKLAFSSKFGLPSFLYFLSRACILVFALGRAALITSPIGDCARVERVINVFPIVFVITNTLLFYIRVLAIYNRNPFIIAFFGFTWLAGAGMSTTYYLAIGAQNIGPTDYCIETLQDPHHLLGGTAIVFLMNDVLLYTAIIWRIYFMFLDYAGITVKQKFRTLLFGKSLPILSKVILLDSQMYFLVIILTKATLVVGMFRFQTPFNVMFVICHLVLVNILACRVFRSLKMGINEEKELQSIFMNLTKSNHIVRPPTFAVRVSMQRSERISTEEGRSDNEVDFQLRNKVIVNI